jgi:hypothetical protein
MARASRSSSRAKKTPAKKSSSKKASSSSSGFSFSLTDTDTGLWLTAITFFFYGASFLGLQGPPSEVFFGHEYQCNEAKNISLWSGLMMFIQGTACIAFIYQGSAADKKTSCICKCH